MVYRSIARAMLLAKLMENTEHVPLLAADPIPISIPDKAPRHVL